MSDVPPNDPFRQAYLDAAGEIIPSLTGEGGVLSQNPNLSRLAPLVQQAAEAVQKHGDKLPPHVLRQYVGALQAFQSGDPAQIIQTAPVLRNIAQTLPGPDAQTTGTTGVSDRGLFGPNVAPEFAQFARGTEDDFTQLDDFSRALAATTNANIDPHTGLPGRNLGDISTHEAATQATLMGAQGATPKDRAIGRVGELALNYARPGMGLLDKDLRERSMAETSATQNLNPFAAMVNPLVMAQRELINAPLGEALLKNAPNTARAGQNFMGRLDPYNPFGEQTLTSVPRLITDEQGNQRVVTQPVTYQGVNVGGMSDPEAFTDFMNEEYVNRVLDTKLQSMAQRDPSILESPERFQAAVQEIMPELEQQVMQAHSLSDYVQGNRQDIIEQARQGQLQYQFGDDDTVGMDDALAREQFLAGLTMDPMSAAAQAELVERAPRAAKAVGRAVRHPLQSGAAGARNVGSALKNATRSPGGFAKTVGSGLGRTLGAAGVPFSLAMGVLGAQPMADEMANRAQAYGLSPTEREALRYGTYGANILATEAAAPRAAAGAWQTARGLGQAAGRIPGVGGAVGRIGSVASRIPGSRFAAGLASRFLPGAGQGAAANLAQGAGRLARGLPAAMWALNSVNDLGDAYLALRTDRGQQDYARANRHLAEQYGNQSSVGRAFSGFVDPTEAVRATMGARDLAQQAQGSFGGRMAGNVTQNLNRWQQRVMQGMSAEQRQQFLRGSRGARDIQSLSQWAAENEASMAGVGTYGQMGGEQRKQFENLYRGIQSGQIHPSSVNTLFDIQVDLNAAPEVQAQQALTGMRRSVIQSGLPSEERMNMIKRLGVAELNPTVARRLNAPQQNVATPATIQPPAPTVPSVTQMNPAQVQPDVPSAVQPPGQPRPSAAPGQPATPIKPIAPESGQSGFGTNYSSQLSRRRNRAQQLSAPGVARLSKTSAALFPQVIAKEKTAGDAGVQGSGIQTPGVQKMKATYMPNVRAPHGRLFNRDIHATTNVGMMSPEARRNAMVQVTRNLHQEGIQHNPKVVDRASRAHVDPSQGGSYVNSPESPYRGTPSMGVNVPKDVASPLMYHEIAHAMDPNVYRYAHRAAHQGAGKGDGLDEFNTDEYYYENEIPAMAAEISELQRLGIPPEYFAGLDDTATQGEWIYNKMREHVPTTGEPAVDVNVIRDFVTNLRDKSTGLGSTYAQWLRTNTQ